MDPLPDTPPPAELAAKRRQEAALAAAAQVGDAGAFGEIYDRYADALYRFIYYRTSHRETAQDLLSETFTKALEKLHQFDPRKGPLSAWLYRIARNAVIDHRRRAKPAVELDRDADLPAASDPAADAETALRREAVAAALSHLAAADRELLIMRLWQEMSHAEIAAALGRNEAAVKVAFSRALAKLRRSLPLGALVLLLTRL
jgi:RNA polymerase sigma-70 factor (ECF subfamily)